MGGWNVVPTKRNVVPTKRNAVPMGAERYADAICGAFRARITQPNSNCDGNCDGKPIGKCNGKGLGLALCRVFVAKRNVMPMLKPCITDHFVALANLCVRDDLEPFKLLQRLAHRFPKLAQWRAV